MRRQNVVRPKRKEEEENSEPKTWASQAETPHPQRCDALCLADDLDLERVCSAWLGSAEQGAFPSARPRRLSADVCVLELEDGRLCFCFAFGCIVCWGFNSMELRRLKRLIRKSVGETLPLEDIETDSMTFSMEDVCEEHLTDASGSASARRPAPAPQLSGDHIVLATCSGDEALAYSYAFAQSVKLAVFETIVDASIEKAKPIPEALAQYGTFNMDEKLVKMQMGAIFVTKCSLTLQTDMLGTPEILWEHDRFDAQYEACRKYLEVGKRVEILDQRLAVLNDLYSFLQTQLEVKHSNKLEWIVIVLIVIEILLDLFHMSPFYTQRSVAICALLLIAGGSVAVAKEVKPSKLWRSRQSSRLWRATLMTLLVLIAWRAPRTKPIPTFFVGGHHVVHHVVPSGPGTQSTSRHARSAVSGRQVWQILPDAERRWLLLGMVGLLGSSCLQLLAPPLVSAALMAAERGAKAAQVKLLAVVALGVALCNGLRCYAFHLARLGFVGSLRQKAFQCYLSKDMSFYDKVDAAELSSRLTSDCQLVFASLDDVLNFLLRSGTVTFFGYLAMLRCCWQLTLVTTLVIALLLLLTRCYAEVRRATTAETQDAVAELSRVAEESLLGIGTVRALGAEETHERLFHEQNERILAVQKRNSYALGGFCLGNASLSGLCRALGLASGGALALSQRISGEVLTQFLFYLDMVLRGVLDLGEDWPATMEALGAGSNVLQTLAEAKALKSPGTRQLEHVSGEVHFDHVTFAYPLRSSRQVLKDVTIHCRAGEMTALVGTSGSGKSSLINLIQGFYSVQSGQVTMDGVRLEEFDPSWLREQLGIVGQEPHFFRGTVAENIAWGSKTASLEEVKEAAEISQAHGFIQQLPKGYDTQIGDGKLLSGGQRQRLAIARALLRDPAVLILDEPTSALDPSTSRLVSRALREAQWSPRLKRRRTVLVIAHRLSTVKDAEQIVVLEKGVVAENGTHQELMARKGSFWRMVTEQVASI